MKTSKFQQRHYETVAKVLREFQEWEALDPEVYYNLVTHFSTTFQLDNIYYKPQLFLAACGIGETEEF